MVLGIEVHIGFGLGTSRAPVVRHARLSVEGVADVVERDAHRRPLEKFLEGDIGVVTPVALDGAPRLRVDIVFDNDIGDAIGHCRPP